MAVLKLHDRPFDLDRHQHYLHEDDNTSVVLLLASFRNITKMDHSRMDQHLEPCMKSKDLFDDLGNER